MPGMKLYPKPLMVLKSINWLMAAFVLFATLPACNGTVASTYAEREAIVVIEPTDNPVKIVDAQEAKSLLAKNPEIIILDVRTPREFAGGHLQKAVLIDFTAPDFVEKVNGLDPDKSYFIYCAVGGRSKKATGFMQKKGFKLLYNANQGFSALKEAGIPNE
jgi:phage shock protein E